MDGRSVRDKSTYYFKNLAGQRFGHLLVIKPVDKTKHGNLIWECQCDCGNFKNYPSGKLVSGRASNCGCMTSGKNALYKNLHKGEEALKQYIKEQIDSDKGQLYFINKFVSSKEEK